ncbi:MAG: D-2-hydroxyacid dehydrogenase [Lachnospiraceae bacterium]|nr:D-2-hydroxyacid dehydrogenase [Lachnospiraceae bacterium]
MPEIRKVVSTVWYDKENYHTLRNVFPEAQFVYVNFYDTEKLTEEAKDADVAILLGDVPDCLLGENSLKWIACDHAGLNGSARDEVFAKNIIVTGAAGRSAPVLAEHCIYFMLQYCYHTKELLAAQEQGIWGVQGAGQWRGLYGRSVGILGMGNNGRMLADRLKAFGMKVYAYDKYPFGGYDDLAGKYIGINGDSFEPILENCDFIVLCLALNDETYHLFNEETFRKMKKDAFLVNMARGGIVDTEALTKAIEKGEIGGAGLDVTEEEPLPKDHPLWRLPSVYITPHTTPQVPNRAGRSIEIIRENARRFRAGEPMLNRLTERDRYNTAAKSGFARLTNSGMTKEEIEKLPLENFLGKRGWTDPAEWNYLD